jgi:GNAT superfamily N-acetyltransferase
MAAMSIDILSVSAEHPSLDGALDRFFDALRDERRYFGPTGSTNPKPFRSLVDSLREREGVRLAAVEHGDVIGVARIDSHGELFLAVVAERRGSGVGTALARAVLARAADLGYRRIVMRSTRRSRAARRIGEQLGCTLIELQRGRTDLILDPGDLHDLVHDRPRSA